MPRRLHPERLSRVEFLVHSVVARCAPQSDSRARDLIRYGSYLAAWCDGEHMPLRGDVVFHPDTIERFVALLEVDGPSRSIATIASVLRSMAEPSAIPTVSPRHHRARTPKAPYDPGEVSWLFDLAARSRSHKRRHDLAALLILGLGAGATGQEAAWVRPRDVTGNGDMAQVILRRPRVDGSWRQRQVEVLPSYGWPLIRLAMSDNDFLLGGGAKRHSRVYDLCDHSRSGRWPIVLDASRLRLTFLVEIARQPHTVIELVERSGLKTLEVFDDLQPYLATAVASPG